MNKLLSILKYKKSFILTPSSEAGPMCSYSIDDNSISICCKCSALTKHGINQQYMCNECYENRCICTICNTHKETCNEGIINGICSICYLVFKNIIERREYEFPGKYNMEQIIRTYATDMTICSQCKYLDQTVTKYNIINVGAEWLCDRCNYMKNNKMFCRLCESDFSVHNNKNCNDYHMNYRLRGSLYCHKHLSLLLIQETKNTMNNEVINNENKDHKKSKKYIKYPKRISNYILRNPFKCFAL